MALEENKVNCPIYLKLVSCVKLSRRIKLDDNKDLVKELGELVKSSKYEIMETSYTVLAHRKDLQYFINQLLKNIDGLDESIFMDAKMISYVINAAMDGILNERYRRSFGDREA